MPESLSDGKDQSPKLNLLGDIGMNNLSQEDFQHIFDFVEILINVKERLRREKLERRIDDI